MIKRSGRTAHCGHAEGLVNDVSLLDSLDDAIQRDVLVKVRDALASDGVVDAGRTASAGAHARVEVVDRSLPDNRSSQSTIIL